MKKPIRMWLLAAILLGINLAAKADEPLTTTITWDTPGTIVVYDGGTSDRYKVELAPNQTSYTATADGFGYLYVAAAPDYVLVNALGEQTDELLLPSSSTPPKLIFDLTKCNGLSYKVNVEKIVYDGAITINFVSGGDVTAQFGGTSREYELQGGEQTVPFSTKFEKTITFTGNTNFVGSTFYIKQNGVDKNWRNSYGSLRHDEITLANGDKFEVKYNDEEPAAPVEVIYHNVTVNYLDNTPKSVVNLIFNTTQRKTISERDSFQVKEGDDVRFVFNTYDYTVTVNGNELAPAEGNSTPWLTGPINNDITVNISSVWREYGNTTVKLSVTDVEGLVARRGALDGEIVDLSLLTPTKVTFLGTEYNCYDVEVSEKTPKVFVEAAQGWWLRESVSGTSANDLFDTRMAGLEQPLYVKTHKITRDKQIAVNVLLGAEGSLDNFSLKNAQRENFNVIPGLNLIYIDDIYDSPFTVQPINIRLEDDPESGASKDDFSVYNDYNAIGVDDESLTFKGINVTEGSVVYLFVKRKPASLCNVRVVRSDAAAASEVKYDGVKTLAAETHYKYGYDDSFQIFNGGQIEINRTPGQSLQIDGDMIDFGPDNNTWKFNASGDHVVVIGDTEAGDPETPTNFKATPEDGAKISQLQTITLTFPYADSVELNADEYEWEDAFFAIKGKKRNYCDVTGEVLAGANVPTVVFTLAENVTAENVYNFFIDEDFLLVNGNIPFGGFDAYYTIKAPSPEDMVITPSNGSTVESFEYLLIEFPYADTVEMALAQDELSFRSTDNNTYANWGWTIEDPNLGHPAFKFTPRYPVSALVDYVAFIPEGFFKVNGTLQNEDTSVVFSLRRELNTDDLEYEFSPVTGAIVNKNNAPIHLNILFNEDYQVQRPAGHDGIVVTLGNDELEFGTEWEMTFEKCYFGVKVLGNALTDRLGDAELYTGKLGLSIDRGAFKVSGADCPAMQRSWNIVEPKEYEAVEPVSSLDNGNVDPEAKVEFILVFGGAESATLERQAGLCLQEDNYNAGRYYEIAENVEEISAAEVNRVRYIAEAAPAFRVTFPALGVNLDEKTFKFTCDYGTFLLDDLEPNAPIEKYYSNLVSGICSIAADGKVTVVGIDGTVILRDASASELRSLPRGLYIVNGSKTIK